MERKVITVGTSLIVVLTIAMCSLMMYFPNLHLAAVRLGDGWSIYTSENHSVMDLFKADVLPQEDPLSHETVDYLKGHDFRLELPINVTASALEITTEPTDRSISLSIEGVPETYLYEYPMYGNSTHIKDLTYYNEDKVGVITMYLDNIFEVEMTREDEYMYFDLLEPHEVYDYIVCVDAGHGGNVPGATKMGVNEKDIDLQIVMALKDVFDRNDKNIGVYYTRTDDSNPSFESRVAMPNDLNADVYISIHNNSTASGRMSSISGTEVMYRAADPTGESLRFSQMCLNHLVEDLGTKNKGTIVGDEIYIIRMSKMPVALIELGFMTNKEELDNLQDPIFQKKAAQSIYDATVEYLTSQKESVIDE